MGKSQIQGNQILNETITADDIKNGTILIEDLSQEVIDLINTQGPFTWS